MAENKTKPNTASVKGYIASRASDQQAVDCKALMAMFKKVTKREPRMWGPSIVGYGSYKYTYDSGRSGESPSAAFAIRGRDFVVYVMDDGTKLKSLLGKLGKHKLVGCCLHFKRMADIDTSVLEKIVAGSIAEAKARYA